MRFIIGFVFFGLLFYLIWMFYPDAFQVLVSWAAKIVDFFRDLIARFTDNTKKEHVEALIYKIF